MDTKALIASLEAIDPYDTPAHAKQLAWDAAIRLEAIVKAWEAIENDGAPFDLMRRALKGADQ